MSDKQFFIYIPGGTVTANMTNIPVTVHLSAACARNSYDATAIFTELGANWPKLLVTDFWGMSCKVEVEYWDESLFEAVLHILVPAIADPNVSTILICDYGSSNNDNADIGLTGSAAAQAVWPDHMAVYHCSQAMVSGTASMLDSTASGLHGTPSDNFSTVDSPGGGKGFAVPASNKRVVFSQSAFSLQSVFIEIFARIDGSEDSYARLFDRYDHPTYGYSITAHTTWTNFEIRTTGAVSRNVGGIPFLNGKGDFFLAVGYEAGIFARYVTGDGISDVPFTRIDTGQTDPINTSTSYPPNAQLFDGYYESSSNGRVYELRIRTNLPTADEVLIADLSLHDNLVLIYDELQSGWIDGHLIQRYDLDVMTIGIDQNYGITFPLDFSLEQIYSLTLETWLIQLYGDVPWITKWLTQPIRSAAVLKKSLLQRWGEALMIDGHLSQEWSMPGMLEAASHQQWGIAATVLEKISEQLFDINENYHLFRSLHQVYALAGETARLYQFDTRLYLDGERIPYFDLEWQATETDHAWRCQFSVKGQELAERCADKSEILIVSAGDNYHLKLYDGWKLEKRFGSEVYSLEGYSKTRDMALATPLLGDIPGGMASQIVADLAAPFGITVDWQMEDGYIADGKLVANDETPLEIARKLVRDGEGGRLCTTADGTLLCVYQEEIAVPDYDSVIPAQTIDCRLERRTTSTRNDVQLGYNSFIVSDQLASSESDKTVKEMIDSRTAEVRHFHTPLRASDQFTLEHKGASGITIEPFGLISLTIENELVEFKAGFAQTQNPIYGIVSKNWQAVNLGNVVFSESGVLESEVSGEQGYSLLWITYITKFYRWIARDPRMEKVQFVARKVDA